MYKTMKVPIKINAKAIIIMRMFLTCNQLHFDWCSVISSSQKAGKNKVWIEQQKDPTSDINRKKLGKNSAATTEMQMKITKQKRFLQQIKLESC